MSALIANCITCYIYCEYIETETETKRCRGVDRMKMCIVCEGGGLYLGLSAVFCVLARCSGLVIWRIENAQYSPTAHLFC